MFWFLPVPLIHYLTFASLISSGFPLSPYGNTSRGFLTWTFLIAVGCYISVLISMIPVGIGIFIGSKWKRHGVQDRKYPLLTLRQQDGFSGHSYFLATGMIQDCQYYFWYRKDQDHVSGGKTPRVPGVRVYESDGIPLMQTYRTRYKREFLNSFGCLIGLDLRNEPDWYPDFYIPPNSIKEAFAL